MKTATFLFSVIKNKFILASGTVFRVMSFACLARLFVAGGDIITRTENQVLNWPTCGVHIDFIFECNKGAIKRV